MRSRLIPIRDHAQRATAKTPPDRGSASPGADPANSGRCQRQARVQDQAAAITGEQPDRRDHSIPRRPQPEHLAGVADPASSSSVMWWRPPSESARSPRPRENDESRKTTKTRYNKKPPLSPSVSLSTPRSQLWGFLRVLKTSISPPIYGPVVHLPRGKT